MRHEFQKSIREKYIDQLINNLTQRFADSELLGALITLFHPNKAASSTDLEEYGNSATKAIAAHFSTTVDSERLQLEWMRFKHILVSQFSETSAHDVMEAMSSDSSLSSLYPYLSKIASISLTLPVSTADCERGFSTMNRIKTDQRNRLITTTLDRLIRLSTEGPSIDTFDYEAAVSTWAERTSRRITV